MQMKTANNTGKPKTGKDANISQKTAAVVIIAALLCIIGLGWYYLSGAGELAPGEAKAARSAAGNGGRERSDLDPDDGVAPSAGNPASGRATSKTFAPGNPAPGGNAGGSAPIGSSDTPVNYSSPASPGGGQPPTADSQAADPAGAPQAKVSGQ